jgi:hypothetical protein
VSQRLAIFENKTANRLAIEICITFCLPIITSKLIEDIEEAINSLLFSASYYWSVDDVVDVVTEYYQLDNITPDKLVRLVCHRMAIKRNSSLPIMCDTHFIKLLAFLNAYDRLVIKHEASLEPKELLAFSSSLYHSGNRNTDNGTRNASMLAIS